MEAPNSINERAQDPQNAALSLQSEGNENEWDLATEPHSSPAPSESFNFKIPTINDRGLMMQDLQSLRSLHFLVMMVEKGIIPIKAAIKFHYNEILEIEMPEMKVTSTSQNNELIKDIVSWELEDMHVEVQKALMGTLFYYYHYRVNIILFLNTKNTQHCCISMDELWIKYENNISMLTETSRKIPINLYLCKSANPMEPTDTSDTLDMIMYLNPCGEVNDNPYILKCNLPKNASLSSNVPSEEQTSIFAFTQVEQCFGEPVIILPSGKMTTYKSQSGMLLYSFENNLVLSYIISV